VILVCSFWGCQGVFAQYTQDGKPCPLASGVTIISPSNTTYGSVLPLLNFSMRGYLNPAVYQVEVEYSIDGTQNVTVPATVSFVPIISTSTYPNGTIATGVSSLFSYYQITGNAALPPLPNGAHVLIVYANCRRISSGEGNWPALIYDNRTIYFTVNDGVPPAIINLSVTNTTYHQNNITLNLTTDKATSWMGYSLDNQTNQTLNANTTLPSLTNGIHTLTVYANDTMGNMGTSGTIEFKVDAPADSMDIYAVTGLPVSAAVGVVLLAVFLKKHRETPIRLN
jgi:hypothetical protein